MQAVADDVRDRGSITIAMTFAIGVIMLIVVQIANVVVFEFGRGAVRGAIDEGARIGARAAPGDETIVCETIARDALNQLAAGLGEGVTITCADNGTSVIATARVHFDGWLTSIADHDGTIVAAAAKENQ
jgi:hypothetical protein